MMDNPTLRTAMDPAEAAGGRRGGRESVIDQDCFFDGTFRTPGNMRIEGAYQGVIECQGTLLIAESGQVNARIVAGSLIVAGQFTGEAQCDSRFEVLKTGRASGSIAATQTVVHDGAFFEGDIRMGGREAGSGGRTGPAMRAPEPAAETAARSPLNAAAPARRRLPTEAAMLAEDDTSPDQGDAAAPPKVNGRTQPAAGRDVLPNRTVDS